MLPTMTIDLLITQLQTLIDGGFDGTEEVLLTTETASATDPFRLSVRVLNGIAPIPYVTFPNARIV